MLEKRDSVCCKSHKGYKSKCNEDGYFIKKMPEFIILAVADGLGGLPGGKIASQLVINAFQEYKFSVNNIEQDLELAVIDAEQWINNKILMNPDLAGMGTTITAAILHNETFFWIHLGDSRLYLLHNKRIRRITTDHTFIQDFIDDGSLTPEQAKKHPLRNMLDQCLGVDDIEPDNGFFKIEKNDRLLLCSDGLTTHLSDPEIEDIINLECVHEACGQLIQKALEKGGTDNITVIIKGIE